MGDVAMDGGHQERETWQIYYISRVLLFHTTFLIFWKICKCRIFRVILTNNYVGCIYMSGFLNDERCSVEKWFLCQK